MFDFVTNLFSKNAEVPVENRYGIDDFIAMVEKNSAASAAVPTAVKVVVEKPLEVEKIEVVKAPEQKPQECQPEKPVEKPVANPVQNQAGEDYPMYCVGEKGDHIFTWRDVIFSIPADKATKEFVAEIKGYTFEAFKRLRDIVMVKPVEQPPVEQPKEEPVKPVEETGVNEKLVEAAPSMMVLSDGSYLFHWGEYDIVRLKEEVDLEYIQKVMSSTYEMFSINAKAGASKEAPVEEPVVTEEAAATVDELQTALKEATASMSQEQPTTQMAEALKKAATEDRKYDESGKPFKYSNVRRKR